MINNWNNGLEARK